MASPQCDGGGHEESLGRSCDCNVPFTSCRIGVATGPAGVGVTVVPPGLVPRCDRGQTMQDLSTESVMCVPASRP